MARIQLLEVALDQTGQPITGAAIEVRNAKTLAYANVYDSQVGGALIPQPLVANDGIVDGWVEEGSYVFNVVGDPDVIQTNRYIELIKARPGTVNTPEDLAGDQIHSDGVTMDTAGLQAAINALQARGGGELLLQNDYHIDGQILPASNVWIRWGTIGKLHLHPPGGISTVRQVTADYVDQTNLITNVSSMVGIAVGRKVRGPGIAFGTTIASYDAVARTITLTGAASGVDAPIQTLEGNKVGVTIYVWSSINYINVAGSSGTGTSQAAAPSDFIKGRSIVTLAAGTVAARALAAGSYIAFSETTSGRFHFTKVKRVIAGEQIEMTNPFYDWFKAANTLVYKPTPLENVVLINPNIDGSALSPLEYQDRGVLFNYAANCGVVDLSGNAIPGSVIFADHCFKCSFLGVKSDDNGFRYREESGWYDRHGSHPSEAGITPDRNTDCTWVDFVSNYDRAFGPTVSFCGGCTFLAGRSDGARDGRAWKVQTTCGCTFFGGEAIGAPDTGLSITVNSHDNVFVGFILGNNGYYLDDAGLFDNSRHGDIWFSGDHDTRGIVGDSRWFTNMCNTGNQILHFRQQNNQHGTLYSPATDGFRCAVDIADAGNVNNVIDGYFEDEVNFRDLDTSYSNSVINRAGGGYHVVGGQRPAQRRRVRVLSSPTAALALNRADDVVRMAANISPPGEVVRAMVLPLATAFGTIEYLLVNTQATVTCTATRSGADTISGTAPVINIPPKSTAWVISDGVSDWTARIMPNAALIPFVAGTDIEALLVSLGWLTGAGALSIGAGAGRSFTIGGLTVDYINYDPSDTAGAGLDRGQGAIAFSSAGGTTGNVMFVKANAAGAGNKFNWLRVDKTPDVQTFSPASSSFTWVKPIGAKTVRAFVQAAGGGGGGGRRGAAASLRGGGGGGGGGGITVVEFDANDLPASVPITIAAGGLGGAAAPGDTADGLPGAAGNNTQFGTGAALYQILIPGGGAGGAGTGTQGGGGGGGTYGGGAGGAGSNGTAAAVAGAAANSAGGGGGGGISAANATIAGASGGRSLVNNARAGGGVGVAGGTVDQTAAHPVGGAGGGGGGSGSGADATTAAGNGGNGGAWGAGGGGGGASTNGSASGAGGNGGSGIVRVVTYF